MADTPAGSSSARAARRDDRRASSAVGVLGLLLAGLVAGLWISAAPDPSGTERSDVRLATVYDPPTTPLELVLVQGDGQLFAAAATDPLVRRPEQIRGGPVSHAYRMQRPMYGWLGWAGSGGQRDLVGIALVAITVVSAGALVWVLARHFEAIGADARLALLALAIPGVVADLLFVGPEILGTVLALVGFLRWRDRADRGGWLTLGCFALAILCRETLVLIPAAIGARELVSAPRAPRRWTPLLAVPVPWLVWVGAMRMRLGAWPTEQSDGNLELVPFGGAWAAAPAWSAGRWGLAAALLGGATVAIVSSRDPLLRWVLAGQLLLAATMGVFVWRQWSASGRLLLPLAVFALLALVERFGAPGMADHAPDRRPGVGTRPEIAVAAAGEVSRGSW